MLKWDSILHCSMKPRGLNPPQGFHSGTKKEMRIQITQTDYVPVMCDLEQATL